MDVGASVRKSVELLAETGVGPVHTVGGNAESPQLPGVPADATSEIEDPGSGAESDDVIEHRSDGLVRRLDLCWHGRRR